MSHVFRLHSTLEVPLETVHEYFESGPEYPEGIETVTVSRRNNTLVISAEAGDAEISKYTPTAQLKATVSEIRVPEDEEAAEERPGPGWSAEPEEEIPTKLVEMAGFKGDREAVLQNTALQYEMFLVLRDLAQHAERGELTAIAEVEGELEATRIVEGERRPASVEVVEDPGAQMENGVDWRNNQYIS